MARSFLNVEKSVTGRRWEARLADNRLAEAISLKHDLPDILGRVLAGRGVSMEEAESFLNPTLRGLMPQPSALRDMEKGAERIAAAITSGERIGVISDYDVDGICSAAMLQLFLRQVGSDCIVHIPDRLTEGYGPSEGAITTLVNQGARLLVTLDCGVTAHDPLAHAAELGLDTVIVDHHQADAELPPAFAVINPNRQDDLSGFGYLCAAGVTMILLATVNRLLRLRGWYGTNRPEPNMLRWLELVALATVCDVVPLKGLNRAYVTQGLKVMARRENIGLSALCDVARLKRAPDCYALGFMLGPRLNAAGRVGSALRGLELLTLADKGDAMNIAQHLEVLNRDRQQIELSVVEQAATQAEASLGREGRPPVIIVTGEKWHPGVVGLAAARLKERFGLPSFVLGRARDGLLAGSGRSIAGVDLGRAVRAAHEAGIIVKGGGHAMAAGLTVDPARLADLRAFLEDFLAKEVASQSAVSLSVDGALSAGGATLDMIELLEQAGPYGSGHPAPLFVFPAHRVVFADRAGNDHVRCMLAADDGSRIKAIAFRALGTELGELLLSERKFPVHVAGRLVVDDFGSSRQPSIHIEDAAPVG